MHLYRPLLSLLVTGAAIVPVTAQAEGIMDIFMMENATNVTMPPTKGPGAMLVNMTISYAYDPNADSNSTDGNATATTQASLGEPRTRKNLFDRHRTLQSETRVVLILPPSKEELESLAQNTWTYLFGHYAAEYDDNLFGVTPQAELTSSQFYSDPTTTNGTFLELTLVTLLNFSMLPEEENLAMSTMKALEEEAYLQAEVRTVGTWFGLINVVTAVVMAEDLSPDGNLTNTSMAPSFSTMPSTVPSDAPSISVEPSISPAPTVKNPSHAPSESPTISPEPSKSPSSSPSHPPSSSPSIAPAFPTRNPTKAPTRNPTRSPTRNPTKTPTRTPSRSPTPVPTPEETPEPTRTPTPEPTTLVCPLDVRDCPDGSSVVRVPPDCDFEECPPAACSSDILECPDGSTVVRVPPDCEFEDCPAGSACPSDISECADGSTVVRVPPDCDFETCPPDSLCPSDISECWDGSTVVRFPPECDFEEYVPMS